MTEENKQAKRIQTSILNPYEKKLLVSLAQKIPAWVSSDMLTFVGFLGSCIMAAGYILSNLNLQWLWLANFGLFVNWFGDSLDGSLARVRNQQRKTYGFFIDHSVDVINETIMFIGVGCSPLVDMGVAMFALVGYFMLSISVYMNCHLRGEMQLTYAGLGPTEFRILLFMVNTLFIFIPWLSNWKYTVTVLGKDFVFGLFDYVAFAISFALIVFYIVGFFKDAKYYNTIDPPVKK